MKKTNPLIYFPEQSAYSWAIYDVKCYLVQYAISSFLQRFISYQVFYSSYKATLLYICYRCICFPRLLLACQYKHPSPLHICAVVSSALFAKRHSFKTQIHIRTPQNFLLSESVCISFLLRLEYKHETVCLPTYVSRYSSVIYLRDNSFRRKCEFYGALEQYRETVRIIKTEF